MDPFDHPDLVHLGRRLRNRLDDTLDAEQYAARAAARRRRSLRDRLLDAEDRTEQVVVSTTDGHVYRGVVDAVGVDHVYETMKRFHEVHTDWLEPAPLLERLAREGGSFGDWRAS